MIQSAHVGIIACVVSGLLVVGCGGALPEQAPKAAPTSAARPLSVEQIATKALPGVVVVTSPSTDSMGTGFIVREDGWILTNVHVVAGSAKITVTLNDERTFEVGEVLAYSKDFDLALLKINARGLTALEIGNDREPRVGEHVVAIGHPHGLSNTVSDGLVSSFRDEDGQRIMQMTAPISPGSSGGPVLDDRGKVIAVTMAQHRTGQNLNLAIPISYLRDLAQLARTIDLATFAKATTEHQSDANCQDGAELACQTWCERGYTGACLTLAGMYLRGKTVAEDAQRSSQLYAAACQGGNAVGCNYLGELYEEGRGVVTDLGRARALYKKACDLGEPGGCYNLGDLALGGKGMARDVKRALQLYAKSCDQGFAKACSELATLYEEGRDSRRDLAKAATFHQRACDHGLGKACSRLATLASTGAGTRRDEARASALFNRACEQGDDDACVIYNNRLFEGRGLPAHPKEAAARMKRLCDGKTPRACEQFNAMGRPGATASTR